MPDMNMSQPTPDDKYIPHMIYMLSFVMDVGDQYKFDTTGQQVQITPEEMELKREELRIALRLGEEDAEIMKLSFSPERIETASGYVDGAFNEAVSYGKPGCPRTPNTLINLANQWRAGVDVLASQSAKGPTS